jgi:hypothetical protein
MAEMVPTNPRRTVREVRHVSSGVVCGCRFQTISKIPVALRSRSQHEPAEERERKKQAQREQAEIAVGPSRLGGGGMLLGVLPALVLLMLGPALQTREVAVGAALWSRSAIEAKRDSARLIVSIESGAAVPKGATATVEVREQTNPSHIEYEVTPSRVQTVRLNGGGVSTEVVFTKYELVERQLICPRRYLLCDWR